MRDNRTNLPAIDWEREYETVALRRREAAENFPVGGPGAAAACGDLADRLRDAGRSGEAEALYREALGLWRELALIRPAAWLPLLAESCGDLSDLLAEAGQVREALDLSREALGLWWELEQKDAVWRGDLAESCGAMAGLLADAGEVREAEELSREALRLWRELARDDAAWEADLADACRSLADLLADGGTVCATVGGTYSGIAPAVGTDGGTGGPAKSDALAVSSLSPDRAKEAEKLYCEALDLYRKLSRRAARYGADAVLVCNNLGTLLCGQGRQSAGEWFYRQALDLHRKQRNRTDSAPYAASACGNLAGSVEERDPWEAERLYRSALDTWRRLAGGGAGGGARGGTDSGAGGGGTDEEHRYLRETADACFRLASFLFTVRGDGDGAESLMREALSYLTRDVRHAEAAAHIRRVLAEWGLADPIIELPAFLPIPEPEPPAPPPIPEPEPPAPLPIPEPEPPAPPPIPEPEPPAPLPVPETEPPAPLPIPEPEPPAPLPVPEPEPLTSLPVPATEVSTPTTSPENKRKASPKNKKGGRRKGKRRSTTREKPVRRWKRPKKGRRQDKP